MFQQPPWRQQSGGSPSHSSPPQENGMPGGVSVKGNRPVLPGSGQHQGHYDWLAGTASAHLSKKEQRWHQQLQTPHEKWSSSQVRC